MEELESLLPLLERVAPRNVTLSLRPAEVLRIVEGLSIRWNYGDKGGDDTASDILTVIHWTHQREQTRRICYSLSAWIKGTIAEWKR